MAELTTEEMQRLSEHATRRARDTTFGGILAREDPEVIYVADQQGTWIIKREDIVRFDEWEPSQPLPSEVAALGRPVSVTVRDGSVILELRPWHLRGGPMGPDAGRIVDQVFTLGGAPLPVGPQTYAGEEQMADLERAFSRQLGWDPDVPVNAEPEGAPALRRPKRETYSKTWVVSDGMCDVDAGNWC